MYSVYFRVQYRGGGATTITQPGGGWAGWGVVGPLGRLPRESPEGNLTPAGATAARPGPDGHRSRVGWSVLGRARVVGSEPVDVDRGTALEVARQGQSIRVRARERRHRKLEGALPPRAQLARPESIEQRMVYKSVS